MRWKIEQFVFCEMQQTLTKGETTEQLEPITVELLAYFCRHPNQTLSRNQLIEHVWAGRIITDNAVTKVITKLRKHFNDDAKAPRFISTQPKRGYRFIAVAKPLDDDSKQSDAHRHTDAFLSQTNADLTTELELKKSKLTVVGTLLVLFISVIWFVKNEPAPQTFTGVKALTRDPGRESRPQVSPDQQYLAYTELRDNKMRLWIKSLADESAIEISHGDDEHTWVDSASWNRDGSRLVYLVTTPQSCQYFMRDFNELTVSEPTLIHNCPAGSYGKIAFTHDDDRIIFTESAKDGVGFELFELNLTSETKRRLNQPELHLGGNNQFDLHPLENRLLISSPDEQQWEGFYSLNLDTDELELLFKQDAWICCGRWDHSGERVILMGEHPATQLVSYNLKGKDAYVLFRSSEQVRVPERHTNGKDYLFPIIQLNLNSHLYAFDSQQSSVVANSSVDEKLAVFAHHDKLIAYVGLASGSEQIWITDYEGSFRNRLTNIDERQFYIQLGWSPEGKYIFALTLNEIHVISTENGHKEILKIPQVEIRGVSWKDEQTIAYSIRTGDVWRVHYYDISSQQAKINNEEWQYIHYHPVPENTLWVTADDELLFGEDRALLLDAEITERLVLHDRVFNLKKHGNRWAWSLYSDGKYQLMLKQTDENLVNGAKTLLSNDSFHFDLNHDGVIYHLTETKNSDIYQTVGQ